MPVQGLAGREQPYVHGGVLAGQQHLAGVAVQPQQQADLVPGAVLGVRGGVRGEAVDQGLGVVGVARGDQGKGRDGVGEALLGRRRRRAQVGAGGRGRQRDLAGQHRDLVGDRVEAGGAEGLQGRGVGAGAGQGELAVQQGARLGRAHGEVAALGRRALRSGLAGQGRGAGEAVQRQQQALQPGLVGVFEAQGAGQPGQFGADLLRPVGLQQGTVGVQAAADAPGRTAQRAGRVDGLLRRARRPGLPVQAQRAEELRGLGAQVAREGVPGHGPGRRVRRFKVLLCHAGASGRL